jgi:hypothetical protein
MRESRYPITEVGVKNLSRRLIEVGEEELHCQDCEVRIESGARINGRMCTLFQVSHSTPQEHRPYYFARVFVDDDLDLPVRFCSYDFPQEEGGPPRLLEEYTYTNIKLNVGLTDWDFDHRNGDYQFLKSFEP